MAVARQGRFVYHQSVNVERVHADAAVAGIAAAITEEAFEYLHAPVARVGALGVPYPASPTLECAVVRKADDIVRATQRVLTTQVIRPARNQMWDTV